MIEANEPNVRADGYLIARTKASCPHCRGATCLVALVVPPGHQALSTDDGAWEDAPRHAFLFYVELLAEAVQRRLQTLAPAYRRARDSATQGWYWANHCEQCDGPQGDHDLFCEPGGAFLPVSAQAAAAIELMSIGEPLRAGAAGYALDPEFLEFAVHL
ncbi:MAG TPA: hypothetical protein VHY75_12865 [Steroidobacteraceae bacterium]|jgi:hypothetical protein|nr:hypothetical protein [Steroidobacteraceae bacterium]